MVNNLVAENIIIYIHRIHWYYRSRERYRRRISRQGCENDHIRYGSCSGRNYFGCIGNDFNKCWSYEECCRCIRHISDYCNFYRTIFEDWCTIFDLKAHSGFVFCFFGQKGVGITKRFLRWYGDAIGYDGLDLPLSVDQRSLFSERCVIMHRIGEYLLSITAAAIICVVAKYAVGEKGSSGKIIRVITGLFMAITFISPLVNIRIENIEKYFEDFYFDASNVVSSGSDMANEAMADIIKRQTEAYILDEAARLGVNMDVEVKLSDSSPPQPYQVVIEGSVSPYQKQNIIRYISQQIGIPQEQQIWK